MAYKTNSQLQIKLECVPTSINVNGEITAKATVIDNYNNLIPAIKLYFTLTDRKGGHNTRALFSNSQQAMTASTDIFGTAIVSFTDTFGEVGFVNVSTDATMIDAQRAQFEFIDNIYGRYLFFRSKTNPDYISLVQCDQDFQEFSHVSLIPLTPVNGSGTFIPVFENNSINLIFIDKNDNLLKNTIFNGVTWSLPYTVIRDQNLNISYINQITIEDGKYNIICTQRDTNSLLIIKLSRLVNDSNVIIQEISGARALAWSAYANRQWSADGASHFINAYHAVAPGQLINTYQTYGRVGENPIYVTRHTSAGIDALSSGCFALIGSAISDDQRIDRIFFQFNDTISVITETVNTAPSEQPLILTRTNIDSGLKSIFSPKEGVTATFNDSGSILVFGVNNDDKLVIGTISSINDFNSYSLDKITPTDVVISSTYIQTLKVEKLRD